MDLRSQTKLSCGKGLSASAQSKAGETTTQRGSQSRQQHSEPGRPHTGTPGTLGQSWRGSHSEAGTSSWLDTDELVQSGSVRGVLKVSRCMRRQQQQETEIRSMSLQQEQRRGWGPPTPASTAGAAPCMPPSESPPLKPLRESAQPAANDHRTTFLFIPRTKKR